MRKFLKRCQERNIRLNESKLRLKMTSLTYVGHLLTSEGLKPNPTTVSSPDTCNMSPQLGSQSQVRATMSPQDQQDAVPEQSPICAPTSATSQSVATCQSSPQRTRSGRTVVKPKYLDDYIH